VTVALLYVSRLMVMKFPKVLPMDKRVLSFNSKGILYKWVETTLSWIHKEATFVHKSRVVTKNSHKIKKSLCIWVDQHWILH
jgi:hypothetical protein